MVETERLIIRPLTSDQLIKYIKADFSLEEELNLKKDERIISDNLKNALEQSILVNVLDKNKNYLYFTLWTIILKKEQVMIGDLCFQNEPDAEGKIEIGYGTYKVFEGNGYMKEAVSGIINWAKTQPKVKSIYAETLKESIASYTILEKNNFIKIEETNSIYKWQLKF